MSRRCLGNASTRQAWETGQRGTRLGRWLLFFGVSLSVILWLPGCRRNPQVDATAELAASFEGSPSKEDIVKAKAAFDEGRYKDSLNLLHKVAGRGDLTPRQKAAMGGIVGQLMQAIQDDPKLSGDVQLHRSMELLVLQTMGRT